MYSKKSYNKTDIQIPLATPRAKRSMHCKKLSLLHIFLSVLKNQLIDKKNIQSRRRGARTNKHVFCHFRWQQEEKANLVVPLRFFLETPRHLASRLSTIDPHKKASFLHFIGPVVQCCRSPKMHTIPISIRREKTTFFMLLFLFWNKRWEKDAGIHGM